MTMPPPSPPPLAERILRLTIRDGEWREAVSGDLREEFAEAVGRRGLSGRTRVVLAPGAWTGRAIRRGPAGAGRHAQALEAA